MNPRLFHAARMGNLGALYELLAEDPLVLEKVYLGSSVSETPLHIAALLGHIDIVKEIIRRKPEFAKELNKDGFTPIHMASANGHINIVRELLSHGGCSDQCVIKDGEGRTPLHYAVIRGRTDIMDELLTASSESIREVTALSETILHLAVKNNQFEALKVLVNKRHIDEELLNAKDCGGNTVLHLAISRKQHLTVKFLLSSKIVSGVEVNAKNASNVTAFDVLIQNSCEPGDMEIGEMLLRAGAMRSQEISNTQTLLHADVSTNILTVHEPPPAESRSLWRELTDEMHRELEDTVSERRSSLMVVAVLIATVTFQAGLNPPAGVWQQNPYENSNNTASDITPRAVMATRFICFISFFIYNTTGFLMSLVVIYLLSSRFPLKSWLRVAVVSMLATYVCGVCYLTLSHHGENICLLMIVLFSGAIISWKFWWLRKWAMIIQTRWSNKLGNQQSSSMERISRYILSFSSRTSSV